MIQVVKVDFSNISHSEDYVSLLNEYALDVMGGGTALNEHVQKNLASEISQRDSITVFLAYDGNKGIGLVTCMEGFSTFKCRPLINIHDAYVAKAYRGQGVSTGLLNAAQQLALDNNCCKLTLEVLQGNSVAKMAYQNFGFAGYELSAETGHALFWEKILD